MNCPECGSEKTTKIHGKARKGFHLLADIRPFKPLKCMDCGAVWQRSPSVLMSVLIGLVGAIILVASIFPIIVVFKVLYITKVGMNYNDSRIGPWPVWIVMCLGFMRLGLSAIVYSVKQIIKR